tara:strand:+ start:6898 stop:7281 length:384 start_codon:yes stop_codon:yes gene_type:complete
MILTLEFNGELNQSLQKGDTAYYVSSLNSPGGFTTGSAANTIAFGTVSDFDRTSIPRIVYVSVLDADADGIPDITPPSAGDYIMFGKSNVINSSSLLGYYAEAKFVNDSIEKVELFSVGSQISESSK